MAHVQYLFLQFWDAKWRKVCRYGFRLIKYNMYTGVLLLKMQVNAVSEDTHHGLIPSSQGYGCCVGCPGDFTYAEEQISTTLNFFCQSHPVLNTWQA